jgi:hypothetical protein
LLKIRENEEKSFVSNETNLLYWVETLQRKITEIKEKV